MPPVDTIEPMNALGKLEWIATTVEVTLGMRGEAIAYARDVEKRDWLTIAAAAHLSRAQAVNIYNAWKAEHPSD